ncbi:MAG: PSD1 domain-containing protein [Candidatus Hydrogenedentes bacterium]|nr:PSD1 domain-containing protein [Candidatus Hydrogenedentota bacterium]
MINRRWPPLFFRRFLTPILFAPLATGSFAADGTAPLSFNRDIRPIFAEHCFKCHGQDGAVRKAGLRLDNLEGATVTLESRHQALVPGNPDGSTLLQRVASTDANDRMPPEGEGLDASEVETLRTWIAQGAPFEPHWAYIAPVKPEAPAVKDVAWPKNDIDRFVLARMEAAGLTPAPPANRHTLIRRLSFDLTGLPPTVAEADAFAADTRPDALEWVLDRLFANPHYGEHRARFWLDLARFSDSAGYHVDAPRVMWPYREWVIRAFNQNMPFDQFTIEQIAGDLLPEATFAQKVATGFHRNTMFNEEGGIDQEEFRTKAVVDRVNTTMTTWMGTTMGCAECHDHKYDPFTQKDFYQLYSFFNNVPELGGGTNQTRAPLMELPPEPSLQAELDGLASVIADLEAKFPPPAETTPANENSAPEQVRLAALRKEYAEKKKKIVQVLVMEEMDTPREAKIHIRGNFLQPGDPVTANTPASWPPLEGIEGRTPNRLDLARWLVDPRNPLTARVTVNRIWQQLFGRGLVETSEDFGTRGSLPSHPELLDYLSVTFVESGWDVKGLLRMILSSATYQQTVNVGNDAYMADPNNVLMARGPRFRLAAEAIRDNALLVSGLLNPAIGGPSVYPYQPPGLWEEKALTGYGAGVWPETTGPDLYRRGLYTFRRRSVPYPTFQAFDAPGFEYCTAERPRTNTPLQALTTMNDPQFVEAARVFGQRILREGGADLDARITFALRQCLTRPPRDEERAFFTSFYHEQYAAFSADGAAAQALIAQGRAPVAADLEPAALAAWTTIANVLLNLDETVTKG